MPNVYVEARPKVRPAGDPIVDYVVEDDADRVRILPQRSMARSFGQNFGAQAYCRSRPASERQDDG